MIADEAGTILDALVAAFPYVKMERATVQIYARFLVDANFDDAIAAVGKWIAREPRFPSISQLRDAVERESGKAPPDIDQAWAEVGRSFHYSEERRPAWSHPAIGAAVAAVGYREIGQSDQPDITRAHFARAYEAAKKRTADPAHVQLVASLRTEVRARLEAARTGGTKLLGGKL